MLAGLDGLAELSDRERFRADEVNLKDFDLGALGDLECGGANARVLINIQDVFGKGVRIA